MKNLKNILLLSLLALFVFTSCDKDDDPIVPDYTTYSFENFLNTDEIELENSNGYSFTVTLNRTSTQADEIDLNLTDASGKFGFSDGTTASIVSFAANESSKTITVQPISTSDISIFETYDITVSIVPPAGTTVQTEFSKSVTASVAVNWESAGDGSIDYGWSIAQPVFGGTSKTVSFEKDSNVELYKAIGLYSTPFDIDTAFDIEFAIVNGEVVIDSDQRMLETDPAVFGANYILIMKVTSAVYDATANTVTLTYDMINEDPNGGNLPANLRTGIVDVITLP